MPFVLAVQIKLRRAMGNQSGSSVDLRDYLDQKSNPELYSIDRGGALTIFQDKRIPWLVWDPSDSAVSSDKLSATINFGEELKEDWFSWKAFEKKGPGAPETFAPGLGLTGVSSVKPRESVKKDLRHDFGDGDSIPLSSIPELKVIRDESRRELRRYADRMRERVMEPLRDVFVAAAIETYKTIADVHPPSSGLIFGGN